MIANFSNTVDLDYTALIIRDTSTFDTGDPTVTSRIITIKDSTGTSTDYIFPINLGVGDEFRYPISKDVALKVTMTTYPGVLTRSKNLLLAKDIERSINEIRKVHLLDVNVEHDTFSSQRTLDLAEKANSYFEVAKYLLPTDLVGAQLALDSGNEFCKPHDCSCKC